MAISETQLERARKSLLEVVLEPGHWPEALKTFAEVCGGASAQLIGRDEQNQLLVHWVTNLDSATIAYAEECGLGDLKVNPRLQMGRYARPMVAVADQNDVSPETRRKSSIYNDFFDRYDLSFNCQAVLHHRHDFLLRASVSKSSSQGPFTALELKTFSDLLPYVQAAAGHQAMAERRAIEGLLAESEAADRPAYVLNKFGRLVGASRAGEAQLRLGRPFTLARRRLEAAEPSEDAEFQQLLNRAVAAWHGGLYSLPLSMIIAGREAGPIQFDVIPLPPKPYCLADEPAVLVLSRPTPSAFSEELVQRRFNLTRAEARIAVHLAKGAPLPEIASSRNASVATIRTQLKSIFAKTGVRRQSELVALIK